MLPAWRNELPWLKDCDSIALQQAIGNFDRAWQNFFEFPEHFERPVAKHRFYHDSFRVVGNAATKTQSNRIWLPKYGWLSFRVSRAWQGRVTGYTISRKANRWYVSLQCQTEAVAPPTRIDSWVGIDVGIAQYATLSDGTCKAGVHAFKRNQRKLARLQRAVSRRQKGSNRRRKMVMRVAKQHAKIAFIRANHAHEVSTELVKNHGRIRMEDLRLVNMMKSAEGTAEKPGKMVAQKNGLNRHLADLGLRQFRSFVEYKLAWSGGFFEAVNPKHTSQRCHACGHIARENRVSQAAFKCVLCGHVDHADVNAAKNIRDSVGMPRKESTSRRRRRPAKEACTTNKQIA